MSTAADMPQLLPPEPAKPAPTTARAMVEMLRRHYITDERHPAWVFAPEIQAPGSARRADVICLGVSAATRGQLVGHEVKVTRTDVMAELADLTKCDPWMRYCDRWWLVLPHLALIDGIDLPDTWGVLLPSSGRRTRSMTVHRPAPALKPAEQAPALRTIAGWQHWRLRDVRNHLADMEKRLQRETERASELSSRVAAPHDPAHKVVAEIVRALGHVHGDRIGDWANEVRIEDVIAALRDLGEVYGRRDKALLVEERTLHRLRGAHGEIARVLASVTASGTFDRDTTSR